jgi:uncharacterized membrane protein
VPYAILEFLHVLAVILWIGPPLGAYYFLFRGHRSGDESRILWCERIAERVLFVEHAALVALIATGLTIVALSDWALLAVPWLQKKLALFAAVMIFEIYDIWFAHRFVRRLLDDQVPLDDPRWTRAARLRRLLILGAMPVSILIAMIVWFAISKR